MSQLGNIIRIRAQEAQRKNLLEAEEYGCRASGARHSFLMLSQRSRAGLTSCRASGASCWQVRRLWSPLEFSRLSLARRARHGCGPGARRRVHRWGFRGVARMPFLGSCRASGARSFVPYVSPALTRWANFLTRLRR